MVLMPMLFVSNTWSSVNCCKTAVYMRHFSRRHIWNFMRDSSTSTAFIGQIAFLT